MQKELSQCTAAIGIDWADKKHDICIHDLATGRRWRSEVRHKAEDLDEWARSLHHRFGGPIAIAVELSKGPIITVLQKYDFFVIYPIDPSKLANHRKTFTTSGAKDDPTDAELALDLLLKHSEHFSRNAHADDAGGATTATDERPGAPHQPAEKCPETVLSSTT